MTNESIAVQEKKKVKCLVWDLDNTIWDGVLLEDGNVTLRSGVLDIIQALDSRGILQSVASKNEHHAAMDKLEAFGLKEYFIYPQINWNSKSSSLAAIAAAINIGIDTLAFIDDQPFEREEVSFMHPEVLCMDVSELPQLLAMPEMNPKFITADSKIRRQMYMSDIKRKAIEDEFVGTHDEFLASLDMKFKISRVQEGDLQRAEELTVRTHQLNTTGYTYSYEELDRLRQSDDHLLLVSELEDRYGVYGKIGLTLVEIEEDVWTIKLLLMSCRVMSRGVGSVMINHLMRLAKQAGATLRAEFVTTDKNRMMYVTYKFAGFKEIREEGDYVVFEHDLSAIPPLASYISLDAQD